ncbi:MAG: hypothetical protein IJ661_02570 [Lachnospiraceae bacterium]|nr:hypothetical protein [Lachnospiraceae bacterium]
MRTGKLPENTFKRSVANAIRYRSKDLSLRPGVGHDGAVFGDMVTAMATTAFYYSGHEMYAYNNAINNVIAAGGKPFAVSLGVLLPEHSEEAELRVIMDAVAKQAEIDGIDIAAGHTELVPTVNAPTVIVTAYGHKLWDNRHKEVKEGLDILMTKWTGLYGGAILARERRTELVTRYAGSYIDIAASYMEYTSLFPELRVIEKSIADDEINIYAAHDVSNGGVFGALWQLLSACNMGAELPVSAIPMKQEIIEVCEYFNINPYMMNGQGSLLIITDNGEALKERMLESGVNAALLGKTITGKKRVITIGDEERYLVAPKGDMLNEVFYGQKVPV